MDNTQNLVWTSNKPTVRGRYRLRCGKHEKDFTVILVENDPDMLFLIGDDFSTMGYKCDGGELWAKLPDEKFTRTADDIFPDVSEHIETIKKEFRARY